VTRTQTTLTRRIEKIYTTFSTFVVRDIYESFSLTYPFTNKAAF